MSADSGQWHERDRVAEILDGMPLKAAGFIVTLYGDVVVPRGGEVWIGDIIETCAAVGISETLVRTAVSRLVAAGRLEGRRAGRRSFYRLAPGSEEEFAAASGAIYGPADQGGWRFLYLPEGSGDTLMAQLERAGYARLKPQIALAPDRGPVPQGVLAFRAQTVAGVGHLREFAAASWDLESHAQAYRAFLARFEPLLTADPVEPAQALTLRLLLVHAYRHVLLADPRLPADALPDNWPGHAARRLFARVYLGLTAAADAHVGAQFCSVSGPLPEANTVTRARIVLLDRNRRSG